MLLATLKERSGINSKHETIQHIVEQRWFDVQADDLRPYPSAITREPRWHCLIAWARKDSVERGWMFDHDERDSWQVTRDGLNVFSDCLLKFKEGAWRAEHCFLWTETFKKRMHPHYVPTGKDVGRPYDLYEDLKLQKFMSLMGF